MLNAYLLKGHVDGWVDDMWFLAKAAIMQLYNLAGAPRSMAQLYFITKSQIPVMVKYLSICPRVWAKEGVKSYWM